MSKVTDVIASPSFAKATEEQKAALNAAVDAMEAILKDTGFNLLINKVSDEKPEYVPQERIDAVTAQKGQLSGQISSLNKKISKLEEAAKESGNEELVKKYQSLIKTNTALQQQMQEQDFNHQLEKEFASLNPHSLEDLLSYIDRDALTIGEDGKLIGVEEEKSRLKTEKSYMFKVEEKGDDHPDRTHDRNRNVDDQPTVSMNDLIRGAAGRGRSNT